MFVYLKQSGELLAAQGGPNELWTLNGIRSSVDKVAVAHRARKKLGLNGLTLVSGAGNIIRGQQLREHSIADGQADLLGRLATIQNTLVLAQGLRDRRVPVTTFLAESMRLSDTALKGDLRPYDIDEVRNAHADGRVVLIGGGTGEDNVTTDHAVMAYAEKHRDADPGAELLVLKGTKHDGVYDKDPARFADAQPFSVISAQYMLNDYERFKVVDKSCLRQIAATAINMRVYQDGTHDLSHVLEDHHDDDIISPGTLIISDPDHVPEFGGR